MAASNDNCVDSVKTAFSQIEDILNDPSSNESVTSILNICKPIEGLDNDDVNVQAFYDNVAQIFSAEAQINGLQGHSLGLLCDIMTTEALGREIERLSAVIKYSGGVDCITNNYWNNVDYWKYIYTFAGDRQWIFQTCNEFGWFQPSAREDNIFGKGSSLDFSVNICSDVFGPEFNKTYITDKVDQTNAKYGGLDINATNVVYIHGSFDPWHSLGLNETKNSDAPVIFIEGTSHCANTYDNDIIELPQLVKAKEEVDRVVGAWLGFN